MLNGITESQHINRGWDRMLLLQDFTVPPSYSILTLYSTGMRYLTTPTYITHKTKTQSTLIQSFWWASALTVKAQCVFLQQGFIMSHFYFFLYPNLSCLSLQCHHTSLWAPLLPVSSSIFCGPFNNSELDILSTPYFPLWVLAHCCDTFSLSVCFPFLLGMAVSGCGALRPGGEVCRSLKACSHKGFWLPFGDPWVVFWRKHVLM